MKTQKKCGKHGLEPECGRLCSQDGFAHLMTRLTFIEGEILEKLDEDTIVALRELMEKLEWEPCAVTMAVGSLVRQGLVKCDEYGKDVFIERIQPL